VAQALLDRAPLVLVTDAVSNKDRVRISHQRLDQDELFRPITKLSISVGVDQAETAVASALQIACAPPAGPVQLGFVPDAPAVALQVPSLDRALGGLENAGRLLAQSRRPVFALGVGVRACIEPVRALLQGKPWPVLTTYKAKGAIPDSWSNSAGLLTGATVEGPVLQAADLIIAVGLDPVELIPADWTYAAPLLSLAEWSLADPYFEPAVELVAPLSELIPLVESSLAPSFDGPALGRRERLVAARHLDIPTSGVGPHHVVLAAREAAPHRTIATVDSGAHMFVAMTLWDAEEPDEALISSGLATMGFAVPAAIAASIARPSQHVVCFVGDGGLGMTLAELETIARQSLPVTVVVFNDSALSLIEIKQRPTGQGGQNAVRYHSTDFAGIARSFGMEARRVSDDGELATACRDAFSEARPFLIDAVIDPSGYPQVMEAIRGPSRKPGSPGETNSHARSHSQP
jgi:acetolactate synthase-1/2/3 large subunit